MRRLIAVAVVALLSLVLASCSRKQADSPGPREQQPAVTYRELSAPPPRGRLDSSSPQPGAPSLTRDRKLVRTVYLQVMARSPEAASAQVQQLAVKLGGYVASSEAERYDESMRYQLTLRVPAERLDEALAAIRKLAVRTNRESQQVEDVTEQAVDLDARLRAVQAAEKELLALLAESRSRRSQARDIVAIYRELTGIRTEIEQLQGQKQSLERQVAFSTVRVEFVPEEVARPVGPAGWRPGETLHLALRMLVFALRGLFSLAVFLVIVVLPVGFLAALPVWLAVRIVRQVRPKKT